MSDKRFASSFSLTLKRFLAPRRVIPLDNELFMRSKKKSRKKKIINYVLFDHVSPGCRSGMHSFRKNNINQVKGRSSGWDLRKKRAVRVESK